MASDTAEVAFQTVQRSLLSVLLRDTNQAACPADDRRTPIISLRPVPI